MFTASFDSGKHWTAPIVVIDDGDLNSQARVVVDNINHAWVSWFDNTTSTVKILAQQSDGSFSVPVVIASSANGNDLGIDRNTGTLYSVLGQYNYGGVLMRSTDRGITWNFQSPLSAAGYGPIQPSIAVDNLGHLYVAYYVWWLYSPNSTAEYSSRLAVYSGDGGQSFQNGIGFCCSDPADSHNQTLLFPAGDLAISADGNTFAEFGGAFCNSPNCLFTHPSESFFFQTTFGGGQVSGQSLKGASGLFFPANGFYRGANLYALALIRVEL